ncbi:MAG: EamA family transporter [Christensenellales bacterium]
MSWFFFALISVFGWGCADLFYKSGTDEGDRYSHLKIAVWVGLVMGVAALCMLPFSETGFSPKSFLVNAWKYAPASMCYIVSMVIGYAGLRYLELSIISPVQNASGALSSVAMLIFFMATGRISGIMDEFALIDLIGTGLIVLGVLALAFVEKKLSHAPVVDRKYRLGALALLFPLLYCVFDTIGTAADGILLDEATGLGLGEIDVLILYGLTFLLAGIVAYGILRAKEGKWYNPFAKTERAKGLAALCEEFGQIFYVYAMALRPVVVAPMVASYCIVSVLLSRIFLKEKLKKAQYVCIFLVVAGIVLLGISEGLSATDASSAETEAASIAEAPRMAKRRSPMWKTEEPCNAQKRGGRRFIAPSAPDISDLSVRRLDQAVIAVIALVDDADDVRIGV